MGGFGEISGDLMRDIAAACQNPVVALLLLGIVFIVIWAGSLVGEFFTEHRKFKVFLPALVDDLKNSPDGPREVIKRSGLLLRQKQCLIELTRHPDITDAMRESLAAGLEYREQKRYDVIVKVTDVVSRVAPMLGLLGTLIPLGPGIVALGSGDTQTLSDSLLIAFDTTSLGLIIAGFALVISAIRGRWYKEYMVNFDTAIECVLEVEKNGTAARARDEAGAAAAGGPYAAVGPYAMEGSYAAVNSYLTTGPAAAGPYVAAGPAAAGPAAAGDNAAAAWPMPQGEMPAAAWPAPQGGEPEDEVAEDDEAKSDVDGADLDDADTGDADADNAAADDDAPEDGDGEDS